MDPITNGSVGSYGFGSRASNTGTIILDLLIVPADSLNSIPLPNGSVYCFGKEVNVKWRHGILQLPPEQQSNDGRISVIAWGWVDMK